MSRTSGLTRRLGVAVSALGLVALASAPAVAMTPAKDSVDCIDYGDVVKAPKGSIPRDDLHTVKKDVLAKGAKGTGRGVSAAAFAPAVIPVRFHVIQKDNGNGGGNLSDARIAAQIKVLNDAYAGSGFSFVLEQTTHTTQPEWVNLIGANGGDPRYFRGSGQELKMKQALYGDSDSETLNIYSASLGQSLLGWAYFPWNFDSEFTGGNPLPTYFDGVVVDFRSLPTVPNDTGDSRAYEVYGAGDTATHEVGHWLGLYHTFQGGCGPDGDFVADTAPEASPAFACPVGRDTCVGGGVDPIHNFMDYTYDECMYEFTAGQRTRMQGIWTQFRDLP
jgi:hypothetical protein